MRSYEEALSVLLDSLTPSAAEPVPTAESGGRFLAEDVLAPGDLPRFDNSAMDGYAVRSADAAVPGARLPCLHEIAAGSTRPWILPPGACARIFTGAPIPSGCDAVLMQEDARRTADGIVEVLEPVRPWENVRFRGEDVRTGGLLLPAGRSIGPFQMAMLLAAGIPEVSVHRRPRVVVASSGDELMPPGSDLLPGQVHDCNAAAIAALVRTTTSEVRVGPVIRDDPEEAARSLRAALESADVVVTAGGASVGDRDPLKGAFEALGGRLHLWRIAMRPGKPFFFGDWSGRLLLGLPGNPVSALVTATLLVLPALRRLQGAVVAAPVFLPLRLGEPVSNPGDRRHFLRITRRVDGSVVPAGIQASHILGSMGQAEGLADIPPGSSLSAGAEVRCCFW